MDVTVDIPQKTIDASTRDNTVETFKFYTLDDGTKMAEVEVIVDGHLKIIKGDLTALIAAATTEHLTIIRGFFKKIGAVAINLANPDATPITDADLTGDDAI